MYSVHAHIFHDIVTIIINELTMLSSMVKRIMIVVLICLAITLCTLNMLICPPIFQSHFSASTLPTSSDSENLSLGLLYLELKDAI